MGVGPGDDVVVPSFTFYASAEAIPPTGAQPVFCDVDPETFCVTAETVRAALTPRTKAVLAVHLFGNVAPVAEIEALGVPVLEDAAQAAGSSSPDGRPGALGTAATFSFFPSKNLGAFGDGGAVTTRDDGIAERVRMLRFHGSRDKQTFELVGHNSRLDELQAAVLRVQLPHLDGWAEGRRRAAAHYEAEGLGELVDLPKASGEPAWHLYVVRHARADELAAALKGARIGHKAYYRVPTHRQPAMREYAPAGALPGTDEAARAHLAIPMSPVLSREQAAEVAAVVRDAGLGRPH
jgi:dTDP-4-amino-4,6-dideoxygalactose transaminase